MVKFVEMKRNAHHGSAAVVVIMTIGVAALVVGGFTSRMSTKAFSELNKQISSDRSKSVFDSVLSKSVSILSSEVNKPSDGSLPTGGLDHLLKNGGLFTEKNHKIFGKGQFEIQVKGSASKEVSGVEPVMGFYAPETNPEVWVESVSGMGCYYKLHIKMDVCRSLVTGRTALVGTSDFGLTQNYNIPCPSKDIRKIDYVGFLDPSSTAFSSEYKKKCLAARTVKQDNPTTGESEKTSEGYWRTLVLHSLQETFVEPCPYGFNSVYEGYSFAGSGFESYGWSVQPQDFADPGSCQPVWHPANTVKCNYDNCDYGNGSYYSFWVISQSKLSAGWAKWVNNKRDREDVRSRLSRCRVCEGPKPIQVIHSYKAVTKQENVNGKIETVDVWPTCDAGYKMLWPGFSLVSLFANENAEFKMRDDDTGSCMRLPLFNVLVRCTDSECHWSWEHPEESTMFLTNLANTDRRYINNDESSGYNIKLNRNRISRCTVCVKK